LKGLEKEKQLEEQPTEANKSSNIDEMQSEVQSNNHDHEQMKSEKSLNFHEQMKSESEEKLKDDDQSLDQLPEEV
jgi:hypothetical protein